MLTLEEKAKIRHHMGYLNVQAAATFQLGIPAAVQTQFMIEGAWDKILPEAENMVRIFVCRLDDVEREVFGGMDLASVTKTGSIEVNPDRLKNLAKYYLIVRESLENLLGVPANPYDARSWLSSAGGGMNVPVRG
jgi:hypothetical protein